MVLHIQTANCAPSVPAGMESHSVNVVLINVNNDEADKGQRGLNNGRWLWQQSRSESGGRVTVGPGVAIVR